MMPNKKQDDDMDGLNTINLAQIMQLLQTVGATLSPMLAQHQESAAIFRKHLLRSEAELLRGLLVLVENEQKRAEAPPVARPAKRSKRTEKVTIA